MSSDWKKRICVYALVFYACAGGAGSVYGAIITWTGTIDNNWQKSGNWDLVTVPTSADAVVITTGNVALSGNGECLVLDLSANTTLNTQGYIINAQSYITIDATSKITGSQITINANFIISSGDITATNSLTIMSTNTITNDAGAKITGSQVTITANDITNTGEITATNGLTITSTNTITNTVGGKITGSQLTINANFINNHEEITGDSIAFNVNTTAGSIDNSGNIIANNDITIANTNIINNTGTITANSDIIITSGKTIFIAQTGKIDGSQITISAQTINISGEITANNDITITIESVIKGTGTITTRTTDRKVRLRPENSSDGIGINYSSYFLQITQDILNGITTDELIIGRDDGYGEISIGNNNNDTTTIPTTVKKLRIEAPQASISTTMIINGSLTAGAVMELDIGSGMVSHDSGSGTIRCGHLTIIAESAGENSSRPLKTAIDTFDPSRIITNLYLENNKNIEITAAFNIIGTFSFVATGIATASFKEAVSGTGKLSVTAGTIEFDKAVGASGSILTELTLKGNSPPAKIFFKKDVYAETILGTENTIEVGTVGDTSFSFNSSFMLKNNPLVDGSLDPAGANMSLTIQGKTPTSGEVQLGNIGTNIRFANVTITGFSSGYVLRIAVNPGKITLAIGEIKSSGNNSQTYDGAVVFSHPVIAVDPVYFISLAKITFGNTVNSTTTGFSVNAPTIELYGDVETESSQDYSVLPANSIILYNDIKLTSKTDSIWFGKTQNNIIQSDPANARALIIEARTSNKEVVLGSVSSSNPLKELTVTTPSLAARGDLITTSGDIIFNVDSFLNYSGAELNVANGTRDFKIAPLTPNKPITYSNSTTGDYQFFWNGTYSKPVQYRTLVLGNTSTYQGTITIDCVPYVTIPIHFQTNAAGKVIIVKDYEVRINTYFTGNRDTNIETGSLEINAAIIDVGTDNFIVTAPPPAPAPPLVVSIPMSVTTITANQMRFGADDSLCHITGSNNLSLTLAGNVTLGGNISISNGTIKFEKNVTTTNNPALTAITFDTNNTGHIILNGSIDTGVGGQDKDINFNAVDITVTGGPTGTPRVAIIVGKNISFTGIVQDDDPQISDSQKKQTNLTIQNSGDLQLVGLNVWSSTQMGVGVGVRKVISKTASGAVTFTTRSTTSQTWTDDFYLESDTVIVDGGILKFEKNIYSPNVSHNLDITARLVVAIGGTNVGTTSDRLGHFFVTTGTITTTTTPGISIYTSDDIKFEMSSFVTNLAMEGSFTYDTQNGGTNGTILMNDNTLHDKGSLTINTGNFRIKDGMYYVMGSQASISSGFLNSSNYTLTMKEKVKLTTNGSFLIYSGAGFSCHAESVLELTGYGDIAVYYPSTRPPLGSVILTDTANIQARTDLEIQGNWTQSYTAVFDPASYEAVFTGVLGDIFISGNTTWYEFTAQGANLRSIRFSNWRQTGDAHTFLYRVTIQSMTADRVLLNAVSDTGSYAVRPTTPDTTFWVINIDPAATYTFTDIEVRHSFASPTSISVDPAKVLTSSLPSGPYWTINWHREFFYVFSFTEDTNGDGIPDRLRIQAVGQIYGSYPILGFGDFEIEVDGYTVSGYSTNGNPGTILFPARFIYAFITPRPGVALTTEQRNRPVWRLIKQGTLRDVTTLYPLSMPDNFTMQAIDTVAPRLVYTLAHPDSGEMYFQFSKRVTGVPSSLLIDSKTFNQPREAADSNGWLYRGTSFPLLDLISDPRWDDTQLVGATAGMTQPWPAYPSIMEAEIKPQYPNDFTYTTFTQITIQGTDPHTLSSLTGLAAANGGLLFQSAPTGSPWHQNRRVSDLLLLAQPPATSAATSIWPNYVANINSAVGGNQLVNQWDGSKSLLLTTDWDTRALSAEAQIYVRDALPTPGLISPPQLLIAASVPAEYRRHEAAGGLWLPNIGTDAFDPAAWIVPRLYNQATYLLSAAPAPEYHYTYTTNTIKTRSAVDFIFKMPLTTSLYAVRLDYKARNWYEGIMPFSFTIGELIRQRGGVSIIENVVNPEKNDVTRISYVLTRDGQVTINVFTLDGNLVRTLYRGKRSKGEYFAEWDGRNNAGIAVARGIYFVRVVAPNIDEMRKVMIVK